MADSFGTFLETKNRLRRAEGGEESPTGREAGGAIELPPAALKLWATATFPTPVSELLDQSGLDIAEFTEALDGMRQADLIKLDDEGGRQVATLTELGKGLKAS